MEDSDWPKTILLNLDDTILAFDSVADTNWSTVLTRSWGPIW